MISSKKVIRDLIVLSIIAIAGILVWKNFHPAAKGKSFQHPHIDTMGKGQQSLKSSELEFNTQDETPAISINGQIITFGQIDSHAQKFYIMMSRGEISLTDELRLESRKQALEQIKEEFVIDNFANKHNIEISQEEVEKELQERFEKIGGEKELQELMKSFGVSRDEMLERVRKDLLENKVFAAVTEKIEVPNGENADEYKSFEFDKWLHAEIQKLDIKPLSPKAEQLLVEEPSNPESESNNVIKDETPRENKQT